METEDLTHNRQGRSADLGAAGRPVQIVVSHVTFECRLVIDAPHIAQIIHRMNPLRCHISPSIPLEP